MNGLPMPIPRWRMRNCTRLTGTEQSRSFGRRSSLVLDTLWPIFTTRTFWPAAVVSKMRSRKRARPCNSIRSRWWRRRTCRFSITTPAATTKPWSYAGKQWRWSRLCPAHTMIWAGFSSRKALLPKRSPRWRKLFHCPIAGPGASPPLDMGTESRG